MSAWDDVIARHRMSWKVDDWEFWRDHLAGNPDALFQILGDLYRVTQGAKNRPPTLDDLWALTSPSYAQEPFASAVYALLDGRSVRWLAGQVGIAPQYLQRILNGAAPLVSKHDVPGSMRRIEVVAKVLKVHPSHFAEWRRLWAMSLIDAAFEGRPNLSIAFFKKFSGLPLERSQSA